MSSRIKISKPERLPREGISDTDLNTWKNELLNYLAQDDDFELFTENGIYKSWEASENNRDRLTAVTSPDTSADLKKRRRQLNNFLTIIAGCCYKDQYMVIIEQATCLEWIWNELKNVYQITHVGKDFLNIVDIKYDPETMNATSIYNAYRAKILENLKPKNTIIKWKNNMLLKTNESLTPTFEDHILLSVIQLIDPRLPSKVREIYGPRMDNEKFLMDFKQDILSNVPKMIEDLENQDNQINALKIQLQQANLAPVRFNNRRSRPDRKNFNNSRGDKFCRLCHLAQKPRSIITSHEIGDLTCPSLSARDKTALQQKCGMVAAMASTTDDDLAILAKAHGYDDQDISEEETAAEYQQVESTSLVNFISPVPSQILTLFQNDKIVHVDIDSGCWVSCVKAEFVKSMSWKIQPNSQLAKLADDKTILKSIGEVDEILTRNNWKVHFKALVLTELHTNVIGGNNFLKDNQIEQSIHNKTITVHGKYVVPETNRHVQLPTQLNQMIIKTNLPKALLPQQSVMVKVPVNDHEIVLVEPRIENSNKLFPQPQLCTVTNGEIEITNNTEEPAILKSKNHHIQLRITEKIPTNDKLNDDYKYNKHKYKCNKISMEEININYDKLDHKQKTKIDQAIQKHHRIFDKDLTEGYNHFSGDHYCYLNWANDQRPLSKKVICPNYNSQLNNLLQEVCDDLTDQGVLAIPQNDRVIVQHVSPCFLRKKQRAKDKPNNELVKEDVRLVVNTVGLSQYLKNIPTKITKPQEVYSSLSKWNYIIKTDLYQGFFQNKLHSSAYQWCAIQTPFGGMRYFKRSIQGLVGQTEEQDELLARILHQELKDGICVKIADDIFAGGKTIDEAIDNWIRIMQVLDNNNLKISPAKTVLFPKQVDVLSWVWKEGGYLSPSPHRKLALQKVEHETIKTVKDLRSYLGLYKTFIDCTPNLTNYLDCFDQLVGSKQSNDDITWTPDLIQAFNRAKEHMKNMTDLYLPRPDDELIITCDGARTPPAVGMILQAKCTDGKIRIVKYFSVKLKPHMIKWNPCEIEACALGTAIESFYDYIKQSNNPVIICPDSKAVVDAAKKLAKGLFSLSPKIQTFLNNLSKIRYDIQHISGKSGHNAASDYQSRTASECKSDICQICNYVQDTSDTIIDVKLNSVSSLNNTFGMPFLNKEVWKDLQNKDHACRQAKVCLSTGQQPTKKSGNTNNDIRRYVTKANISKEGLLVVNDTIPMSTTKQEKIVIPSNFVEAIITQLHVKYQHPAKSQLVHLFNRYFFATGSNRIIDNTYDKCQICQANKKLPSVLTTFSSSTIAQHPGTHFGIDIMRRSKQKIMVARDQFSSYITAFFISDETKNTLRDAIILSIDPVRSKGPVTVRTDNAAAFKSLSKGDDSLNKLGITLELSDPSNKNGNACVDRAISEIIDEIKKIVPPEQALDQCSLSQAILQVNTKLRRNGKLSASEILFSRDQLSNQNLSIKDEHLQEQQKKARQDANNRNNSKTKPDNVQIQQGDFVQLKENPKKHHSRDTYLVVDINNDQISTKRILNVHNDKRAMLRNRNYDFKLEKIQKLQKSTLSFSPFQSKKTSKQSALDWNPIKHNSSTDNESSEENDSHVSTEINDSTENNDPTENIDTAEINDNEMDENIEDHDLTLQNNSSSNEMSNSDEIPVNDDISNNDLITDQGIDTTEDNYTTDDDWQDANDGDDEFDERISEIGHLQGAIPKSTIGKMKNEIWSTKDSYSLRITPYRKQKIQQKITDNETLRNLTVTDSNVPLSTETTRTRIISSDNNSIVEPSIEWDNYEHSPTYFEDTVFHEDCSEPWKNYPETVEHGRVYDFSNLPPLKLYPERVEPGKVYNLSEYPPYPINLDSDFLPADNESEAAEKPKKKKNVLKKIQKKFF